MGQPPEEAIVLPGRQGLPPADVIAEQQRERLFTATVDLVAKRGYRNTSIGHIIKAAKVGSIAFYNLFAGKEECFLAAFDRIVAEAAEALAAAAATETEWPRQIAAGLACGLDLIVADPRRARVALVEVQAAGPVAYRRYEEAADLTVPKLREGRAFNPDTAELSPILEQAVLGGILWVVHQRLVKGELKQAEPLLDEAIQIALSPYLGDAKAREVAGITLKERSTAA